MESSQKKYASTSSSSKKEVGDENLSEEPGGSASLSVDGLAKHLENLTSFLLTNNDEEQVPIESEKPEQLLKEVTFQGVADYIQSERCKNIIVLSGAGISTSAGIPDFRSPETGLYHNLQKYDLPNPQAIFEISYFKENPDPFFVLAKELYPGTFKPTPAHYFVKLLEQKNLLKRIYTQNIDTLERVAEIDGDKIVEAHGTFHTSHCLGCNKEYSQEWMKTAIFSSDNAPRCTDCDGLVKPDIVFFGESLPERFAKCVTSDFLDCGLLIILGTSLQVQPFASLVMQVPDTTPRLLINRDKVGESNPFLMMLGICGGGMDFGENGYRDVFWEGNCDDGCRALCSLLGWLKELDDMVKTSHNKIDKNDLTSSSLSKSKV